MDESEPQNSVPSEDVHVSASINFNTINSTVLKSTKEADEAGSSVKKGDDSCKREVLLDNNSVKDTLSDSELANMDEVALGETYESLSFEGILARNDVPGQSNGINSSAADEEKAGTSGSIKKRTLAQSRNYRSKRDRDPESSNDMDAFPGTRSHNSNNDNDERDWDVPYHFLSDLPEDTPSEREGLTNDDEDMFDYHDPLAGSDITSSSHRSSTPTSDIELNDTSGNPPHSSSSSSPESRIRRRLYESGLLSSSSSSSSSFIVEHSESSSSSSDDYLEDLDERLSPSMDTNEAEGGGGDNARNSDQGEEGASASASVSSSTSRTKKSVKKIPKRPLELPKVLLKPKPKQTPNFPKELLRREMGLKVRVQSQSAEIFRSKLYGCLFSAERLELMKKLEGHHGCVNCLNFNYSGTRLASGSDDLTIKIWDYAVGRCVTSFHSGHKANVFQAKFVPFIAIDTMIVSCARDNQVRLTELDSTGGICSSRKLAQHKGPAHKLSISPENPHVVLSCGEDGIVFNIDIREERPERLIKVHEPQEGGRPKKIALYSIHQNPLSPHQFCVTGKDQYIRIYDTRTLRMSSVPGSPTVDSSDDLSTTSSTTSFPSNYNVPIKKFCPHQLVDSRNKTNVTAAVYNYNGNEIVASYNDENIYLFDATHSDGADCIKVYEGHRNNATVKGVNFFGDRSQFVVSGSDCGNIFIWDKETESIVNFFRGDENGVVNCLEGHPTAPILATSGLDDDVKIWIPSNENSPKMSDLAATVRKNLKEREDESKTSDMDGHIMWALWSHLRRADRERRRGGTDSNDSNESWWRDEDDDEDDDDDENVLEAASRGVECTIM